jgi:Domain of unknown function (DUF4326)
MAKEAKPVQWTTRELELRQRLERGQTVVVNVNKTKGDRALVAWGLEHGLLVYIGRAGRYHSWPQSIWANPLHLGKDGDRNEICDKHAVYLAGKPELLARIRELKGKALGCWCAPERCHGDHLAELANQS